MEERVGELEPALLERARAGDHAAFRQLVRVFDPGLRSLAFRLLGDAGPLDRVLQEAYVKAYRNLGAHRGAADVRTWLYRLTYTACIDDIRRRSRVRAAPTDRAPDRSGPAAALAGLSPEQRAAVLLVDAEGFDHAAAGRVLGVTEATVASRVARARVALRDALHDSGEEER